MRPHPTRLAAVSLMLASGAWAEDHLDQTGAVSSVRQVLRQTLVAKVGPVLPAPPAPPVPPVFAPRPAPAPDTVVMAPFVVKERRQPSLEQLDTAMAREKLLESHALYHKDLPGGRRLEFLLPPGPGTTPGISLPVLRLSW